MILLLLACGEEEPALTLDPAKDLFFRDVSVFVGHRGEAPLPHQDLRVAAGRVAALGPTGSLDPAGAEVVEGQGRTLLPGYVDAHTHMLGGGDPPGEFSPPKPGEKLEAWLRAGVVGVVDMGGLAGPIAPLAAARGQALPRVRFTDAQVIAPGGHPTQAAKELLPFPVNRLLSAGMKGCHSAEQARAQVEELAEKGVSHVKIIRDSLPPGAPVLSEECLRAAVEAAHARGLPAYVHVGSEEDALAAVRAGADALAHGVYKGGLSPAGVAEIAAAKIPVIPTLSTFQATAAIVEGAWEPDAAVRAQVPEALWAPLVHSPFQTWPVLGPLGASIDRGMAAGVLALHNAGVTLLIGSDAPLPGAYAGLGFHAELRALAAAGVPPLELLWSATAAGAAFMGDDDFGTVEVGNVADLVLVEGDPSTDIARSDDVVLVLREGRRVRDS